MAGYTSRVLQTRRLNYSAGGGEGGSRGLRRARLVAAAPLLRGALLRGGLEPGELLCRRASLRLGLGRGTVRARRARAHRHGAEVTCGIYSRKFDATRFAVFRTPCRCRATRPLPRDCAARASGAKQATARRSTSAVSAPLTVAAWVSTRQQRLRDLALRQVERAERRPAPSGARRTAPAPAAPRGRPARSRTAGSRRGATTSAPPRRSRWRRQRSQRAGVALLGDPRPGVYRHADAARGSSRRQDVRCPSGNARSTRPTDADTRHLGARRP